MALTKKIYLQWLSELKASIKHSELTTALQVNKNRIILYWHVGKQISTKINVENYGSKVIDQLSEDLQKAFPNENGFSLRNLRYMRKLAETYPDFLVLQQSAAKLENKYNNVSKNNTQLVLQQPAAKLTTKIKKGKLPIVQQPAAQSEVNNINSENLSREDKFTQIGNINYTITTPQLANIPWGHIMLLLDKIKNNGERLWYIQKTIENNWSRAVLQYQIDTDLFQRQAPNKKTTNFKSTLPKVQSDLANQIFKDPYIFRFTQIGQYTTERELEKALVNHIQEFILELGAGFAFVGRQVNFKLGRKNYYIDLLFYHLYLRCFVVIEIKMEEFEFDHIGQLIGYLNMVNKQRKHSTDNQSIGIILCGSKDNIEVDFALANVNHPIGVAEYKYGKTLPKNIKDKMPTAKQLQTEVKSFLKKNKSNNN